MILSLIFLASGIVLPVYRFLVIFFFIQNLCAELVFEAPLSYQHETNVQKLVNVRVPKSHIKVFIPSIPYSYISHLTNGSLLRLSDNDEGWEFMMAKSYLKKDPTTYIFKLRENIFFQDGTPFNAHSVHENFSYFIKQPFTYTDIHKRLKSVEVLDSYTVAFHLNKPYGMFFHDLARINLYTSVYLQKFGWQGSSTGDSTQEPGKYGLGPYILHEGFATGRKQTKTVTLKANPYYYEEGKPYIETITIYTELPTDRAVESVINEEGVLDIAVIPFNKKIETVLSPYAKLVTMPSTHNITNFFNLMKPNGILKNKDIRLALNQAIDQQNLLTFVYKREGFIAPSAESVNYSAVKKAIQGMKTHGELFRDKMPSNDTLVNTLNGVVLNVVTQDRFMFLWRGIEYQLQQYGVSLNYHITSSEKELYELLLTNRENPKEWDILTWGNDDWYGNHPWTVFFTYRTSSAWSAIDSDDIMQELLETLFYQDNHTPEFLTTVKKIVQRAYDEAYMLIVPSPNLVMAINKEIFFKPSSVAIMPLWDAKITSEHWSLREGAYKRESQYPFFPLRYE